MRPKSKYELVPALNIMQKYLYDAFHCKVSHKSIYFELKFIIYAYNSLPLTSAATSEVPQRPMQVMHDGWDNAGLILSFSLASTLLNCIQLSGYFSSVIHIYSLSLHLPTSLSTTIHLSLYPSLKFSIHTSISTSIHPFNSYL